MKSISFMLYEQEKSKLYFLIYKLNSKGKLLSREERADILKSWITEDYNTTVYPWFTSVEGQSLLKGMPIQGQELSLSSKINGKRDQRYSFIANDEIHEKLKYICDFLRISKNAYFVLKVNHEFQESIQSVHSAHSENELSQRMNERMDEKEVENERRKTQI